MITGKSSRYKLFWVGNKKGIGGIGVMLAEKLVESIFDVNRISDRIMPIKLAVWKSVSTVMSVYAPQPRQGS